VTEDLKQTLRQFAGGNIGPSDGDGMCALTLIYHEDVEPEIIGIIQRGMTVARYTKVQDVVGARADMLQQTDYEPHGQNQMLIIFAERSVIHQIADALRDLRRSKRHGLRGYVTPVEEVI